METEALVLIAVLAAVTYPSRLPLLAARRRLAVPSLARSVLGAIPVAAFSAIAAPAVLAPDGSLTEGLDNPRLAAAAATVAVSLATRSLLAPVVAGCGALVLLDLVAGG